MTNAGAWMPLAAVSLAGWLLPYPAAALDDPLCLLWARAATVHDLSMVEDRSDLKRAYDGHYLMCRDRDDPPPPLKLETDDQYLDRLWSHRTGDVPAIGESGAVQGTAAWNHWCQVNFPGSFHAADGTVILEASNKGRRVRCPG